MAFSYTDIRTQQLDSQNYIVVRGYNTGTGVECQVYIQNKMAVTVASTTTNVSAESAHSNFFIDGATVSSLTTDLPSQPSYPLYQGIPFKTLYSFYTDDRKNTKKYVAGAQISQGVIVCLYSKTVVKDVPQIAFAIDSYLIPGATISGTDILGGATVGVAPWFSWNGTDLSQFDTKVEGSAVASSTIQVTSFGGFNWLDMSVTSSAGVGTSSTATAVVLPISTTPPTADYAISFEFISITRSGNNVGSGAVFRYVSHNQSYFYHYTNYSSSPNVLRLGKITATEVNTYLANLSDPVINANYQGHRAALAAINGSGGSGVFLRMLAGEHATYLDTSSPWTGAGRAGLWQCTLGLRSVTTRSYFRNIKCYLASDIEKFEI
jgi:hypothetical protein